MSIQPYARPYAKLLRDGRDFICSCPFHETSDPSLRIYRHLIILSVQNVKSKATPVTFGECWSSNHL
jgi:hypothetical protein